MKIIKNPDQNKWEKLFERPFSDLSKIDSLVREVFEKVRIQGDKSLIEFTERFDKVKLENICVSEKEFDTARVSISEDLKTAITKAKANIFKFHSAQKTEKISLETSQGVVCSQEKRPIGKVGLYIPSGTAALFSTVLMLAIPASIAKCKEIVICTPPNKNGDVAPEILYAAEVCGLKKVYKIGGIQAIAAMTFGTNTIAPVYKIFGPGNSYVTVAKQFSTNFGMSIDMPAGPSELMVISDDSAIAEFVAADLLSQAEHGGDSQVILISTSASFIEEVQSQLDIQTKKLPRKEFVKTAIKYAKFIAINDFSTALKMANYYAPEHLIICTRENDFFVNNIENAGSVFIGNYSPESAGDYASGTNHTLPTGGFARSYSGITLNSFMKSISFQEISKQGILLLGKTIETMAEAEGLHAHKNAVNVRLKHLKNESNRG